MPFTYRNTVLRALNYAEGDQNFAEVERMYTAALQARDIAVAAAKIYVDTTAGLAATAEGGYFTVPDTSTGELVVYRKESGAAVQKVRIGKPFVGGTLTGSLNEAPPVTIASAATTDIAGAASNTVIVSGTAAITALGTIAAGAIRRIRASGAFTLTHNATSLILYGSNIVAAVGEVFRFESLGGGNWRLTGRHYAGPLARTDVGNTFTAAQFIAVANEGSVPTTALELFSDSTTPAAGDYLATLDFTGRRSDAAKAQYAFLRPQILDPAVATRTAKLDFVTYSGGSVAVALYLSAGAVIGSPTGGDLGAGTLNAQNLYVNNSAVLKQSDVFVSADQTITLAGTLTLAHGLGVAPRAIQAAMVCQTAELGYAVGDVVTVDTRTPVSIVKDATNLVIRYNSAVWTLVNKTTGALTNITAANWKARFLAIK